MLCKYCGRLITSKTQCLCCGSNISKKRTAKLTPEQIAEYELAVKQREEAMLKAEQERIERRVQLEKRKKKLVANIVTYLGLGLAAITLILVISKLILINSLSVKGFEAQQYSAYSLGEMGLVIGVFACIVLLIATIMSKKAGIKLFFVWLLIGVVCIPMGFVGAVYGNNNMYCQLSISGIKSEYVVGEEIDLTGLTITAVWETGHEEVLNIEEYKIVIIPYSSTSVNHVSHPEYNTIYIMEFHTDTSSASGSQRTIYFELPLIIEDDGSQNATGMFEYTVANA